MQHTLFHGCAPKPRVLLQVTVPTGHRSRPSHVRKRGIGETGRSFSYHAPGGHARGEMMYVGSPPRAYHMSHKNSRYASRTSMDPISPGESSGRVRGGGVYGVAQAGQTRVNARTRCHSLTLTQGRLLIHMHTCHVRFKPMVNKINRSFMHK